ncbi:MAG TPA: glycosyltransferase [Arenibaculum sp.]|nr:glycosyltransferase [Arenibaculum sp.]
MTAIVTCMTDAERPYVREALDSVERQTELCRIILMVETNNRWIDGILREDEPVTLVRTDFQPAGHVRNVAIRTADTEFVAFLDGDDFWDPRKIECQLAVIDREGVDLVGTDHVMVREDGVRFAFGRARHIPMLSTWLVRRSTMLDMPFGGSRGNEDGIWWANCTPRLAVRRLPRFLCSYRVRAVSVSSTFPSKRRKELLCRAGSNPILRPVLLSASFLINAVQRRPYYVRHPDWSRPGLGAGA